LHASPNGQSNNDLPLGNDEDALSFVLKSSGFSTHSGLAIALEGDGHLANDPHRVI
jgi:hypothetical protein